MKRQVYVRLKIICAMKMYKLFVTEDSVEQFSHYYMVTVTQLLSISKIIRKIVETILLFKMLLKVIACFINR